MVVERQLKVKFKPYGAESPIFFDLSMDTENSHQLIGFTEKEFDKLRELVNLLHENRNR